jgi:hypothetical protein
MRQHPLVKGQITREAKSSPGSPMSTTWSFIGTFEVNCANAFGTIVASKNITQVNPMILAMVVCNNVDFIVILLFCSAIVMSRRYFILAKIKSIDRAMTREEIEHKMDELARGNCDTCQTAPKEVRTNVTD